MNLLDVATLPLLPVRLAVRALDDLHRLARGAGELPEIEARLAQRVDELEDRMAQLLDAADGGRAELRAAVRAARRLDDRAAEATTTLGGVGDHADAVVRQAAAFEERANEVLDALARIEGIAARVALEGGRVAEALPAGRSTSLVLPEHIVHSPSLS